MVKLIGLNGLPILSKKAKNLKYLELQEIKKNYEILRLQYLEDLNFRVTLFNSMEKMDATKQKVDGVRFGAWTDLHSQSLEILRKLIKYLEDNKFMWDYKFVNAVIESLPIDNKNDTKKIR